MENPSLLPTYARVAVSDWGVLGNFIYQHTRWTKDLRTEGEDNADDRPALLTDQNLKDAFEGPYSGFFKQSAQMYATITRIRMAHILKSNDFIKEPKAQLGEDKDQAEKKELPDNLLQSHSIADLDHTQSYLGEMVNYHHDQWLHYLDHWYKCLLQLLTEQGLEFIEMEIDEFKLGDPICEVRERYIDLNIQIPGLQTMGSNFSEYLRLKLDMLVLNSLARRQLPHEQEHIDAMMATCRQYLADVATVEQDLLASQMKELIQVVGDMQFALEYVD